MAVENLNHMNINYILKYIKIEHLYFKLQYYFTILMFDINVLLYFCWQIKCRLDEKETSLNIQNLLIPNFWIYIYIYGFLLNIIFKVGSAKYKAGRLKQ